MMLGESSLSRRLLLAATAFIAIALVVASVVIGFALHRFIQGQIDQRLDTQVVFITSMLRANGDGSLSLIGNADGPPFERARRGWYWQVTGPKNKLLAASLAGANLDDVPEMAHRPPPPPRDDMRPRRDDKRGRPAPADGEGPEGDRLHYRIQKVLVSGVPATIVVSAPRAAVLGPLRDAMVTLGISLAVLGLALMLAIGLQVRLGLRPLERLRQSVAAVRAGRSTRVPANQPREVQPLVEELNGLLDENTANLERARRNVANLAHGLKTPLATLALATSATGDKESALTPLVDEMERRIRHHLGRARAAVLSGPARAQTAIAPRIADLGAVLNKVYAERRVAMSADISPEIAVACEPQDFDEMAGNLMENAFKWSRSKITIRAERDFQRKVIIAIEDDGPGLIPENVPQVLLPGERLDESAPGFGFGLSIARELAELYGGELHLGTSPLGGLAVSLKLPEAAAT